MTEEQISQSSPVQTSPSVETKGFGGWWERKTGEKLKRSEKVIGILLIVVFLFVFYVTLDANKYAAEVRVIEGEGKIGVNPTTESLDFGDLSRGTTAMRAVKIENHTPVSMFVMVFKTGGISDLIKQNENNFMLRKGEQAKIEFTLFMPASANVGDRYSGRVFVFKIPAPFL